MELILREDIHNLGRRGDVVRVSEGYGRNFLLPKKLAVPLTEGNKKAVEQQKTSALKREVHEKAEAEQLAAMIAKSPVTIARKAGETGVLFGSVTSLDVTEALHSRQLEQRKYRCAAGRDGVLHREHRRDRRRPRRRHPVPWPE